jgi:uncharacterized phage protein (TIGR02218 family)
MPLLRSCSTALALALEGGVQLGRADAFEFDLVDGVTRLYWNSSDVDLTLGGNIYSSQGAFLARSKWNLVNTMQVPSLEVFLRALNAGFSGGAQIKEQIYGGLFDGASFAFSRTFTPLDAPTDTSTYGAIELFAGDVCGIDIVGNKATIAIKGKNNRLDQYAPRNVFQTTCIHAFCDAGCTLSRATFTASYTSGAGATELFIPWSGSPPPNAATCALGTITFTSGVCAGQRRTISAGDSSGLSLVTPLLDAPTSGDTFTAFQGCDKSLNSGSGQSCTAYANTQNFRAFPFKPPVNAAY